MNVDPMVNDMAQALQNKIVNVGRLAVFEYDHDPEHLLGQVKGRIIRKDSKPIHFKANINPKPIAINPKKLDLAMEIVAKKIRDYDGKTRERKRIELT